MVKIAGCTTIMAQFSSASVLQDSLTYMYYTSKCLYMSLLYKYNCCTAGNFDLPDHGFLLLTCSTGPME
jgi:hypothetical protein